MKKILLSAVLVLAFAATSYALPVKTAEYGAVEARNFSPAQDQCYLEYYNFCGGWVWVWSGFTPGAKVGVCFDLNDCECLEACELCDDLGVVYWALKRVTPYGNADFEVFCAYENCCPCGTALAGVYGLPLTATWTGIDWTGVTLTDCVAPCDPCKFIYMLTINTPDHTNVYSDGDNLNWDYGCGTTWCCTPHSFVYVDVYDYCTEFGAPAVLFTTDARSTCPPYQGYIGFFMNWLCDATIACTGPSAAEESSWSEIKALYR